MNTKFFIKIGGILSLTAGIAFFLMVIYMFTLLPRYGWDLDMFDNPARLLPWVAQNTGIYKALWTLYFISQACLLPVPVVIYNYFKPFNDQTSAYSGIGVVFGTASITLSISVLIIYPTTSPIIAEAYFQKVSHPQYQEMLTLLHTLFTDMAKEIRLFSEILLGFWLGLVGYSMIWQSRKSITGWAVSIIGAYTTLASITKIINPYTTLEDPLGFILALLYCWLGVQLLRYSRG